MVLVPVSRGNKIYFAEAGMVRASDSLANPFRVPPPATPSSPTIRELKEKVASQLRESAIIKKARAKLSKSKWIVREEEHEEAPSELLRGSLHYERLKWILSSRWKENLLPSG
jgi:hypothetical protein